MLQNVSHTKFEWQHFPVESNLFELKNKSSRLQLNMQTLPESVNLNIKSLTCRFTTFRRVIFTRLILV